MKEQLANIPRFASDGESVPNGAILYYIDGKKAFISPPDRYQPLVGDLRRNQLDEVNCLRSKLYSNDSDEIAREIIEELSRKARRQHGKNRRTIKLRGGDF